jgi:hypothetical protein
MIDIERERLLTLKEACRAVPGRAQKGLALSTVWRWALHGRKGHKLETVLVGGQRYTSREAIQRFVAALNFCKSNAVTRSVEYRKATMELVERQLAAEGFGV